MQRVWLPEEESPGLAMSRAFGDYCIKDFGLISVPEVTQRHITNKDQFVVLATDGVSITLLIFRCLKTIPGTFFGNLLMVKIVPTLYLKIIIGPA